MKEIETDKILLKIYEEQQQMKKDNEENQKSIVQKIYDVQEQMEQKIEENQKSIGFLTVNFEKNCCKY